MPTFSIRQFLTVSPFAPATSFTPAQNATSVLRIVSPSKMLYSEPITSKSRNAPSPSKIDLAVAGRSNDDRSLGRPFGGQEIARRRTACSCGST